MSTIRRVFIDTVCENTTFKETGNTFPGHYHGPRNRYFSIASLVGWSQLRSSIYYRFGSVVCAIGHTRY